METPKYKYYLLAIMIANEDKDKSYLPGVKHDIQNFKDFCKKYDITYFTIENKNKKELLEYLERIKEIITLSKVTNVLLTYSGHGFENNKNLITGIYSQKGEMINLPEITNYLSDVNKLYIMLDCCRVQRKSEINYDKISNNYVMLATAVEYECKAKDTKTGGHYSNSFYKILDLFFSGIEGDYIGVKDFMIIFLFTFKDYIKKDKGRPNFFANKNVRERDPKLLNDIMNLTKQHTSNIPITRVNVQADINTDEINLIEKNKECTDMEEQLLAKLKSLHKLLKSNKFTQKEKQILEIDIQILEIKINQCKSQRNFIINKIKQLTN